MNNVRIKAIVFAAVLFSWLAGAAMAAGEGAGFFYEWKDDKGVVNVADDLSKVPDKYRSKAKKLGQPGPGSAVQEQQQPQEPPVSKEAADRATQAAEDSRKAGWQLRMQDAKRQLAVAEDRYSQTQQRRNELASKWGASGAALPPQEALDEMNRLDGELAKAKIDADKARNDIEVTIPDEARRAGIPPGWLRE